MTGSLQIKNGKYYAVINTKDNTGKRKQKWFPTGYTVKGNKKKAEQFLADKIKELQEDFSPISGNILFSDFAKTWLSTIRSRVDEVTYQGYENVLNAHIIPYFESSKLTLCNVTRDIVQTYIDSKAENGRKDGKGGLSPKTIKTHRMLLNLIFKEAQKRGIVLKNPCDFVTVPRLQQKEIEFYNEEQLMSLFKAIENEELYPLVYLTVIYGLRRSEVLGLKWDSINYEANLITIKHTVVKCTRIVEKDSTKTHASRRSYPITNEVSALLESLKKKETANRKLFGAEYKENGYIFKWADGKPYAPDYITRKFKKLLKQYGLPPIRFHDLRHSCASLLIAKGFGLKDIQEWLGHADFKVTANIYAHLDAKRKQNIASSMTNSFSLKLD